MTLNSMIAAFILAGLNWTTLSREIQIDARQIISIHANKFTGLRLQVEKIFGPPDIGEFRAFK